MSAISDYYGLLEVGETADAGEIKRAYHRLARRYHPDCTGGDSEAAERFRAVREAYDVLSDPARRAWYDRMRQTPANGHAVPPLNGHARSPAPGGLDARSFTHLFGQAGGRPPAEHLGAVFARFFDEAPSKGPDVEVQVLLSFEQALKGGRTTVAHPVRGQLRLAVPRGVRSGRVCLPGHGAPAPAPGGAAGDLYVTYRVEPSERFRREGDDLHVVETVSALEVMLGGKRTLVNAYGQKVTLPIPPGTQPGDRLRLRGQGVATERGTGDLYVEVQVVVPRDLSDEQRAALTRAARRCGLL